MEIGFDVGKGESVTVERGKYISFVSGPNKPKTKTWYVEADSSFDTAFSLGIIVWFAKWRCYAFEPSRDTVFEKQCLRDIADFCERKTKEHKVRCQK